MPRMTTQLMREVRFSLTAGDAGEPGDPRSGNTWAGWPASDALVPYLTLQAVVNGNVDPKTGYVCNIRAIEDVIRRYAVDYLRRIWISNCGADPVAGQMTRLWEIVAAHTPQGTRLQRLTLHATPYLAYTVNRGESPMVAITYAFEFSAAHRLYCDELTEEENRRLFGHCTNPNGHGHNYVVQVTIKGTPDPQTGVIVSLVDLERIVNQRVIDYLDHKHLNLDCPEFATLNPSVENITRVIYDKLVGAFSPAALARVRVYETPKTYAEFSADHVISGVRP